MSDFTGDGSKKPIISSEEGTFDVNLKLKTPNWADRQEKHDSSLEGNHFLISKNETAQEHNAFPTASPDTHIPYNTVPSHNLSLFNSTSRSQFTRSFDSKINHFQSSLANCHDRIRLCLDLKSDCMSRYTKCKNTETTSSNVIVSLKSTLSISDESLAKCQLRESKLQYQSAISSLQKALNNSKVEQHKKQSEIRSLGLEIEKMKEEKTLAELNISNLNADLRYLRTCVGATKEHLLILNITLNDTEDEVLQNCFDYTTTSIIAGVNLDFPIALILALILSALLGVVFGSCITWLRMKHWHVYKIR
jgi:hypothetical protein